MKNKNGILLIQLGCSKNSIDGERFLGILQHNGISIAHSIRSAHTIVINTCGFIEQAKAEAIEEILNAVELKNKGLIEKVYVMGCLVTRNSEELMQEIPEIDGVFGVSEWQNLAKQIVNTNENFPTIPPRYLLNPKHYAYLRIADGCNRGCSYCAIPLMRGKYKSVPLKDLVSEATLLKQKGVKELILIAQEVNDYGKDLKDGTNIKKLLTEIDQLNFQWMRILYTHPPAYNDGFLDAILSCKTLVPYIDFPIEHSHPKILWSMGRKKSPEFLLYWINQLRKTIPNLVLRTSIIVGYPGEGEEEFEHLVEFVKEASFERLGVFCYSKEEGTKAEKISLPEVDPEIAKYRQEVLLDLGAELAEAFHRKKLGEIVQVMVETKTQDGLIGRTVWDAPDIDYTVTIENGYSKIGCIVNVCLDNVWEGGWKGSLVNMTRNFIAIDNATSSS
ncbi:MAG: 30S ribosomal protein S12 methylthiotransferase RimO [bacterium]|nr:30S ribosomal protein S12 methylthiotransferase RimO [bacterium]